MVERAAYSCPLEWTLDYGPVAAAASFAWPEGGLMYTLD